MKQPYVPPSAPKTELGKFIAGFGYAFQGIWYVLRTQRNARVHLAIATIIVIMSIVLRISTVEFAVILLTTSLIFMAEMFNTVFEACIDLIQPEYHPLAKIAKDVAAGAVLLGAIFAVLIGIFILGPHLLALL